MRSRKRAAAVPGEEPVEQRGARAADVQVSGRRGREARDDRGRGGHRRLTSSQPRSGKSRLRPIPDGRTRDVARRPARRRDRGAAPQPRALGPGALRHSASRVYFALPAEPRGLDAGRARGPRPRRRSGPPFAPARSARVLLLALLLPALGFGGRGAAHPDRGGAGPGPRDDGERRGAGDRPRPVGQRPAARAARPGGDPRARARAHARRGSASRSTRRRPPRLLEPGRAAARQARLSPPAAPAEPGGFDFRRIAWFERIGAVGYARAPVLEADGPDRADWRQLAFRAAHGRLGAHPGADPRPGRRLRRGDPDRRPLRHRPPGRRRAPRRRTSTTSSRSPACT